MSRRCPTTAAAVPSVVASDPRVSVQVPLSPRLRQCCIPDRRIEHQIADDRSQTGVFLIGPLERGQATTLGNSLRRVLMGNLEGTAVTAVRIAGVNHEYATIPGVREDVLDILLNCKQITVNSRTSELEIGRLVVAGPATVKARDLQFSSQVQVIDERVIATVGESYSLELEVHVERGIGYRPVDRHNEHQRHRPAADRCCVHASASGEFHHRRNSRC